jgi:hypothetical protein
MNSLLNNLIMVVIIAAISVGISILWRTCIYTRGAIFRPVGRLFDLWVFNACKPTATLWDKTLRFIAYPLGRCIYCSQVHIGYNLFFYINYEFQLNLYIGWLVILIPIGHMLTIIFMKKFITFNSNMIAGDWTYMDRNMIFDLPKRKKEIENPMTKEDEDRLEECKSGFKQDWKTTQSV